MESLEGQPRKITLKNNDMVSLRLLQEKCPNLATLETLVHSRNSKYLFNTSHDNGTPATLVIELTQLILPPYLCTFVSETAPAT